MPSGSRDASERWSATGAQTGPPARARDGTRAGAEFAPCERGNDDADREHREHRRP
jgi:hypothetical protein